MADRRSFPCLPTFTCEGRHRSRNWWDETSEVAVERGCRHPDVERDIQRPSSFDPAPSIHRPRRASNGFRRWRESRHPVRKSLPLSRSQARLEHNISQHLTPNEREAFASPSRISRSQPALLPSGGEEDIGTVGSRCRFGTCRRGVLVENSSGHGALP